MHLIDVDFLREAFRRVRKNAAPGIDGVKAKEYAEHLEENLQALYERMRSGRYKAPPVKRIWLEKEDGKKRPVGMTTFEDKIVQRAVAMLLGAIYEQDFYNCSYGFRPKRNPHQALDAFRQQCNKLNVGWIVDADVSGFFDNIDHDCLREILKQRVNDGGVIRFIVKWLNAGVMEGNDLHYPEQGSPQGGVISPMLSNIYLHHVLDDWFMHEVQSRMRGNCFLVRFADDFIIGCEKERDAQRIMEVLPKRFARFGLTIHPEKTTMNKFRKPNHKDGAGGGNGTFDFLGFTHYWAKSRRGNWVIKKRTAAKRLKRTMKKMWIWCRKNRHLPIKVQHRKLCQKLRGYYQYYAVTGNYAMLERVFKALEKSWKFWLSRRSQKSYISWKKYKIIREKLPLPRPRIIHRV